MIIAEIIAEFGVSRQTVAEAIRDDRLKNARKRGNQWYVPRADVAAYFAASNAAGRKRGRPRGSKNVSKRETP